MDLALIGADLIQTGSTAASWRALAWRLIRRLLTQTHHLGTWQVFLPAHFFVIAPRPAAKSSANISGMEQRISDLGGQLQLANGEEGGLVVRVVVPL